MGPRPGGHGKTRAGPACKCFYLRVSMGPRPGGHGKASYFGILYKSIWIVSMGPRPGGHGKEAVDDSTVEGLQGFNGATTRRSW